MATLPERTSQLSVGVNSLPPQSVIFGRSPAMQEVRRKLVQLASANIPVLIQVESGTGKEIIAQLIHRLSPGRTALWLRSIVPLFRVPCLRVSCSAMRKELSRVLTAPSPDVWRWLTGELCFWTKSEISRPGLQAKLLQLLQDGQVLPDRRSEGQEN